MRKVKYLIFFVLAFQLLLLPSFKSHAQEGIQCIPSPGINCNEYRQTVIFDKSTIPEGLEIRGSDIFNPTKKVLYIIREKFSGLNKTYWSDKLVENHYNWGCTYNPISNSDDGCHIPEVKQTPEFNRGSIYISELESYQLDNGSSKDNFESKINTDKDIEIIGDNPVTMYGFFDGKLIEIKGVLNVTKLPLSKSKNANIYDNRTLSEKIFSNIIPIFVGLLLIFLIYKIFKKWRKLWGLGVYLCILLSIVLTMILTQINSLRDNLENVKIYGKILSILNYPGIFVAEKVSSDISMIFFFLTNITLYTLIGWILYKIFKKKPEIKL